MRFFVKQVISFSKLMDRNVIKICLDKGVRKTDSKVVTLEKSDTKHEKIPAQQWSNNITTIVRYLRLLTYAIITFLLPQPKRVIINEVLFLSFPFSCMSALNCIEFTLFQGPMHRTTFDFFILSITLYLK